MHLKETVLLKDAPATPASLASQWLLRPAVVSRRRLVKRDAGRPEQSSCIVTIITRQTPQ